jgi:tRNA modification GTPase
MSVEDTIAAVSTPSGTGGIGIIRISGNKAFEIASKIFKGKKNFHNIKTHTINYGKIIDNFSNETIDEVLLSKMAGPNTFTKEDIVEINCHGGYSVLQRVLDLVIMNGARPAEPGEFTKRAFLNGRIDLAQAEAVMDIINSKTRQSLKVAINQLEGKLSKKIKGIRNKLIELIAHIEVTVDYPEHDLEEITGSQVYESIKCIKQDLEILIKGYEKGRIIREGISAVIVGKPNVGKSSLLNEFCGHNKAIVTEIPGTTRDMIEEYVNLFGIPVKFTDTAGIRETSDTVEKIGIDRAKKAIEDADIIIAVFDAITGIDKDDEKIINSIGNKKTIYVINKLDAVEKDKIISIKNKLINHPLIKIDDKSIESISLKTGEGLNKLESILHKMFIKGDIESSNEEMVTNIRHKNLLLDALKSLNEASDSYEAGMPLDFITIDIRNAAEYLGEITGESVSEDVANEIFNKFCIGK